MALIIGHIGSDAGYTIINSDGTVHRVPGWSPEQFLEVANAARILQLASGLKTPGLREATVAAVNEFVQGQLREHLGAQMDQGAVLIVLTATTGDVSSAEEAGRRYAAWFYDLDAWTEYWDIYHPESRGRFYFGDDDGEEGLLSLFLPRRDRPPAFKAWTAWALGGSDAQHPDPRDAAAFRDQVRVPTVAAAVREVDDLVGRLFAGHFSRVDAARTHDDYLEAMWRFARDALPPAPERVGRLAETDPRRRTAGSHTLDGDLMWFAWALHLEAANELCGDDGEQDRRALMMAGIAMGCPADFVHRGHRRTRPEYRDDASTTRRLRSRGVAWAEDFDAAAAEVRLLFRIREWGEA